LILLFADSVILSLSLLLAFAVRFEPDSLGYYYQDLSEGIWVMIGMQLLALLVSGLYRSVLRYAGAELLILLLRSILLGAGFFALLDLMTESEIIQKYWEIKEYRIPRSIIVMGASFSFLGLLSFRLAIRWIVRLHLVESKHNHKFQRVAIYGAGSAGLQLFESLRQEGITIFQHL